MPNKLIDKLIQPVPLEIRGRKFELVYDFNAIADAETLLPGVNLLHGAAAIFLQTMTASQLRGLLYACLRRKHPKITLAQAGELCGLDTGEAIREALVEAVIRAHPKQKKNPTAATAAEAEQGKSEG